MQQRNKLLLSSKKELIKICKQNNINTKGCLAKMDYVGKILQSQQKQQSKSAKKKKKTKKTSKNKKKSRKKSNKTGKKKQNKKTDSTNAKVESSAEPKKRVPIDWDGTNENKAETDSSEYDSDSLELIVPEYIPKRVSLTEIFNINILQNEYDESNTDNIKKRIKFGFTPLPKDNENVTEQSLYILSLPKLKKKCKDLKISSEGSKKAMVDRIMKKHDENHQKSTSLTSNLSTISDLSNDEHFSIHKFVPSNTMATIMDNEDESEQDFKEEMMYETDPFKRMDKALGQYYKYFGKSDYFDGEGQGKFVLFCVANELLDEGKLNEQFIERDNPQKCPYLAFDDEFPLFLTKVIESNGDTEEVEKEENQMRVTEIYNVLEYCFHHGQSPYF